MRITERIIMRRVLFVIGVTWLSLLLTVAGRADELVLLSPHWEGIKYEFEHAFKRIYTADTGRDVRFTWIDVGGTSEILRFIRSEFANKPDGIGIDVLFGGGLDPFLVLKQQNLLQRYKLPPALLRPIPSQLGGVPLYDADGAWYGATLAGFGILYNRIVLKWMQLPQITTWDELAQPVAFSWVGSADPRKSGSVHMMYEIILQAYGWEKGWEVITGMGANVRQFTNSSAQTPKDTALGEVAYGLSIDFQAWAQINETGGEQLKFVMPPGLTVINPDAIAMLRGAPHRAVAEAFIRFILSAAGQKLWLLRQGTAGGPQQFQLNRFSLLPQLYTTVPPDTLAVQANPFDWRPGFMFDSHLAAARWRLLNDLIGTLIVDQKAALNRAWRVAISNGLSAEERQRLTAMPLSEGEALRLAGTQWHNPEVRNQKRNEWTRFARDKYRADALHPFLRPVWFTLLASACLVGSMLWYLWRRPRLSRVPEVRQDMHEGKDGQRHL
jgi:ABC-type Fe3+ transport system substrate-binding protein